MNKHRKSTRAGKWFILFFSNVFFSRSESELQHFKFSISFQGLNYAVLADAAWGAYMRTMLIDPFDEEEERKAQGRKNKKGRQQKERKGSQTSKHVPIVPLSQHAKENLNALRRADTVTSDPHKTGYCPYPAGGLSYRNGTMKDFVLLAAPEVFHSEDDLSVGVNGLEGSKPGAAGAGVLLSHRVYITDTVATITAIIFIILSRPAHRYH